MSNGGNSGRLTPSNMLFSPSTKHTSRFDTNSSAQNAQQATMLQTKEQKLTDVKQEIQRLQQQLLAKKTQVS